MKNILIVYYSRSGYTEKAVIKLAEVLGADVEKIVDLKNRQGAWGFITGGKDATFKNITPIQANNFNPQDYEILIFASPTWASVAAPAVRTYIGQHKAEFKKVAFLVSQGGICNGKIFKDLEVLTGKSPLATVDFSRSDLQGNEWRSKLETFAESIKS
ncbi:MAG: flavodoxin family protein [Clostridiaceae bacterium]|nr:flavodoxin family protein [Clostridiaceae bacterium]